MQDSDTVQLVMETGPQPGQVYELPRSTVSIGRDPGNQIAIDDPQVSRQHARITPQGGLMVLEDLGSTNGTTVNGLRISAPHTLAHGDEIGLGDDVTLLFYGWPDDDAGKTQAVPRTVSARPSVSPPRTARLASEAAAYGASPAAASEPPSTSYAEAVEQDYEAYTEYYDDYPQEDERNWALYGLGCILIAIIIGLLLAIYIYFFAPASIVDPIADFLAGLGIAVP